MRLQKASKLIHRETIGSSRLEVLEQPNGAIRVDTWLPIGTNWSHTMPEFRDWCDTLEQARIAYAKRRNYLRRYHKIAA